MTEPMEITDAEIAEVERLCGEFERNPSPTPAENERFSLAARNLLPRLLAQRRDLLNSNSILKTEWMATEVAFEKLKAENARLREALELEGIELEASNAE